MNLASSHIDVIVRSSVFEKTLAGRAEILDRSQKLSLPERQVLILADGLRDVGQLQQMLGTALAPLLDKLQGLGLLQPVQSLSDDSDEGSGFDDLSDEAHGTASAVARFDAASARFFRAKTAAADNSDLVPAIVQAPSPRGMVRCKLILLEALDHMEPKQAVHLSRRIAQVDSEAALYYVFEQTVQAIRKRVSGDTVQDITLRFDEEVCQI